MWWIRISKEEKRKLWEQAKEKAQRNYENKQTAYKKFSFIERLLGIEKAGRFVITQFESNNIYKIDHARLKRAKKAEYKRKKEQEKRKQKEKPSPEQLLDKEIVKKEKELEQLQETKPMTEEQKQAKVDVIQKELEELRRRRGQNGRDQSRER